MKKISALILCLVFILSLAACGKAMNDVTSDAKSMGESVVSGTESIADDVGSAVKGDHKDTASIMAGITADDAKRAALKHAGLDESQISNLDIDLDRDNGMLIYEVDFNSGNTEYDYDINAQTGEVISSSKSRD